jgi:hypothetical protein
VHPVIFTLPASHDKAIRPAYRGINEIMDWFHLSREQVVAVIEFAARRLDAPPPLQQFAQAIDAHTL